MPVNKLIECMSICYVSYTLVYVFWLCYRPVKKVGKTGRRSGRRRVLIRPINTGTSTTESDGNDLYDGMSDDSLTLGEKKLLSR